MSNTIMVRSVIPMPGRTATGFLLWFETDEFDAAIARATAMGGEVVKPPHRNPPAGDGGPNHRECWLRDLDGYMVVLASPDGEASDGRHQGR